MPADGLAPIDFADNVGASWAGLCRAMRPAPISGGSDGFARNTPAPMLGFGARYGSSPASGLAQACRSLTAASPRMRVALATSVEAGWLPGKKKSVTRPRTGTPATESHHLDRGCPVAACGRLTVATRRRDGRRT